MFLRCFAVGIKETPLPPSFYGLWFFPTYFYNARIRVRPTHRRWSDWNSGWRMAGHTIKVLLFFLHCNASNLVLKILQHDKIWGDNSPAPNSGGTCPPVPPWSTPMGPRPMRGSKPVCTVPLLLIVHFSHWCSVNVDGKSNREVLVLVQNFPIFRECVEIDQLADLFMHFCHTRRLVMVIVNVNLFYY